MADKTFNFGGAVQSLNQLLNWYLNESDHAGQNQPWLVSDLVPNHLREFASLLRSNRSPESGKTTLKFDPIASTRWYRDDAWFADSVDQIAKAWEQGDGTNLVGPCILHGSMGGGDYSLGWSDFDIFAVVPDTTIEDPTLMLKLRSKARLLRETLNSRVPLQHHGIQFVTTDSLNWFDEASLPIAALSLGKTLGPSVNQLSIRPVFDRRSSTRLLESRIQLLRQAISRGELRHHAYEGVFLQSSYKNASNGLYQLKYLLDICTLAPAIALGATGMPSEKGSALAQLSGEIQQSDWTLIHAATEVRSQWPEHENMRHTSNEIPAWVQEMVEPDYFEQALRLHEACLEFAAHHQLG
jgi:hypothetical protein